MKILLKIILLLPFALPVTILLVRWPVAFALVGVGLSAVAIVAMVLHIFATAPKLPPLPPAQREPPATVDGRPVWDVEVLP